MPDLSQIEAASRTAARWLLDQQHSESYGWSETRSRYANAFNTAEGIIGLLDANVDDMVGGPKLEGAAAYLESQQVLDGPNAGCWVRDVYQDDKSTIPVPDVTRTGTALEALLRIGRLPTSDPIVAAIKWLESVVAPKGDGWGYGPHCPTALLPTTKTLRSLVEAKRRGWSDPNNLLVTQLSLLAKKRQPNGSFGLDTRLAGVNTIAVGLLFQKARTSKIWTDLDIETSAIDWVKDSPDAAVSPATELIQLDSPLTDATYEFVHIPDVFTLQLLAGSVRDSDRSCPAFLAAQLSLSDRIDPTGGVFGYRTYTWATSHALGAMSAIVRSGIKDFPTRNPGSPALETLAAATPGPAANQPPWRSTKEQIVAVLLVFVVTAGFGILAFVLGGPTAGVACLTYFVLVLAGALTLIGKMSGQGFLEMFKSSRGHLRH